jgi:YD repeat-containing protein
MPAVTDPATLDPRFRALEAVPDPPPGLIEGTSAQDAASHLHPLVKNYRAIVLLAPGAERPPDLPVTNVVQLLDDTFIAEANLDGLRALAMRREVVYVEAPRPADVDLVDSVAATSADRNWPAPRSLTGKGVVDDGLDFTLDDFRDAGSTRVLFLWDQRLNPVLNERHPAGYVYGVEYSQAEITAALGTPNPFASVRHHVQPSSHGTHVAGIAAGRGWSGAPPVTHKGVAYEADIVFVQYNTQGQPLTSSDRVAEAIKYVFDKARRSRCQPLSM